MRAAGGGLTWLQGTALYIGAVLGTGVIALPALAANTAGPASLLALQVVGRAEQPEVAIPGKNYDFGTLIAAQAIGDHESLVAHERRVLRVTVDDLNEIA